jgi:hypothetical protein
MPVQVPTSEELAALEARVDQIDQSQQHTAEALGALETRVSVVESEASAAHVAAAVAGTEAQAANRRAMDLEVLVAGLTARVTVLEGGQTEEPPPPPTAYIADVPAHVTMIEESGRNFVAIDLMGDVVADRDLTFDVQALYENASPDDLVFPPTAVMAAGTGIIMLPVDLVDDDLVEGEERLSLRFTCRDPHVTMLNDTTLVHITDGDVVQPQPEQPLTLHKVQLNAYQEITFSTWFKGWERYDRFIPDFTIEAGKTYDLAFWMDDRAAGGVRKKLPGYEYGVLINGIEVLRVKPNGDWEGPVATGGYSACKFKLVADSLPASVEDGEGQWGLRQYNEQGLEVPVQGTLAPSWFHINRAGRAKDAPFFVFQSGSFDVARNGFVFHYAKVPRGIIFDAQGRVRKPRAKPLQAGMTRGAEWTAPYTWTDTDRFTSVQLIPYLKNDNYQLTMNRHGVPNTNGCHVYMFQDFENKDYWIHPSTDGDRGVGSASMVVDPQNARLGGAHFLEHGRFARISDTGRIETIAGWVHDHPAPTWNDEAEIKRRRRLVGRGWELMPVAKRGLDRVWRWCWVQSTLRSHATAPAIPNDGNNGTPEVPHQVGPAALIARRFQNDLLEVTHDPNSHLTEASVALRLDGQLRRPWAVIEHNDIVMVTEEAGNCVSAFRYGTWEKLWESAWIQAPQGMDHDGQGNVTVASFITGKVHRFHMDSPQVVTHIADHQKTGKSNFAGVGVSKDGKTGPVGWFAVANYAETVNFGHAQGFHPSTTIALPKGMGPFPWSYVPHGKGGGPSCTYSLPANMSHGSIIYGGADVGLIVVRLAKTGEPKFDHNQYTADAAAWSAQGFDLVYGVHCRPWLDIDLPRGFSPATDRFIATNLWGDAA